MNIPDKLIHWYQVNKRVLPWRGIDDPFKIWLSEIIMQQTRMEQGMKYYQNFVNEFEDIHTLASAPEEKIMRMWQGLGYYNRARNLHAAARQVVNEYNGQFPVTYKELIKLKGIGDYTAAAIASVISGESVPAVDGNVKRVISRLFDIRTPIDNQKTYNQIRQTAKKMMSNADAGTFNQAMMDFGALICKPRNPDCENCPLNEQCLAYKTNMAAELPIKYRKQTKTTRYFNYLVFEIEVNKEKYFLIEQRNSRDIWNRLFQFPVLETDQLLDVTRILNNSRVKQILNDSVPQILLSKTYRHILSHQEISAQFFRIMINYIPDSMPIEWKLIPQEEIDNYAIPKLIEDYLSREFNF